MKNNKRSNVRKTTEQFIEEARQIHGDKYNYSKVEYINAKTKVCIICPIHGEFWQRPNEHLKGCGCPKCGIEKKSYTTEEFIEKARKVHGGKYDYSKVEYTDSKTKVCIICPEHGEFWQTPQSFLEGHGCQRCTARYHFTQEEFINEAKKIYGDKYDLSKTKFINSRTKITFECPIHGKQTVLPHNFLKGKGCPKCAKKRGASKIIMGLSKFINLATEIHNNKYYYSKVEYVNSATKVCIICPEHGEFWQSPNSHLQGHGCPFCVVANAKLTNKEAKTRILERLEGTDFELVNVDYKDWLHCNLTVKCKECGTFKKLSDIYRIRKTCPTCEHNKHKQRAIENVSKCKTLKEFRGKFPNDYVWFHRNGLLEEMTNHLERGHCKLERLIYAYEIYIEGIKPHAYIGLTYNLKARDRQHLQGGERDSLWRFCKEHNIPMPKPKILLDNVSENGASRMEAFYEKQYRERGFETINVAKCGSLGGGQNHTFEEIEAIGKKYSSRKEWEKNDRKSYLYALNHYKNINGKSVKWIHLIIPQNKSAKKPVIGYNLKTKETRLYESIGATEKDGFDHTKVCLVCCGKYDTHKGWIFRYIVDGERNNTVERKIKIRKPVIGYNPKTKETRLYESISAAEKDGFDHACISVVCSGKSDFHKGWIFRYIVDGEIENVA